MSTTMTMPTAWRYLGEYAEYTEPTSAQAEPARLPPVQGASTRPISRVFDRFSLAVLPLAAAAALLGSVVQRETWQDAVQSATAVSPLFDVAGGWAQSWYSEEWVSIEEAESLRSLLALAAPDGFDLDFPDF